MQEQQEVFNADVFVQFIPMQAAAAAADFIAQALFRLRFQQALEINQRNTQLAASPMWFI